MGHSCSTVRLGVDDNQLLLDSKTETDIRVLVLGASSSGKTTLAKQMRVWLSEGFTPEERNLGRQLMIYNLVKGLQERLSNKPSDNVIESALFHPKKPFSLDGETKLDEHQVAEIRRVYPRLRNISDRQLCIPDGLMEYAFSMLSALARPDYLLTDEEMFRIRIRTSGKHDLVFNRDGYRWTFTDAGGQPNERSKWEHFADGIDAIVFVVALDEWDAPDTTDAFDVGSNLCGSTKLESAKKIFIKSASLLDNQPLVILFNRYDLFSKKLTTTPINNHPTFSSYDGPNEPSAVFEYIKDWFYEGTPRKRVFASPIVALSTDDVKSVGKSMMDFIFAQVLASRTRQPSF